MRKRFQLLVFATGLAATLVCRGVPPEMLRSTNELAHYPNPNTGHYIFVVASDSGTVGDGGGGVWAWVKGATNAPTNIPVLGSATHPGEGLFVKCLLGVGWLIKDGVLQPENLTIPVQIDSQIRLGPGNTNLLFRDGGNLIYTNGFTTTNGVNFLIRNGDGATTMLGVDEGGHGFVRSPIDKFFRVETGDGTTVYNFSGLAFWPQTPGMQLGVDTRYWDQVWLGTNGQSVSYADDGTQLMRNGAPVVGDVSVRAFGAKADGVTDDTVAIQAALTKQHDSWVELHKGSGSYAALPWVELTGEHYVISEPLVGGAYMHLKGQGKTIIEQIDPTKDILEVTNSFQTRIEGIIFLGGKRQINWHNPNYNGARLNITDCQFWANTNDFMVTLGSDGGGLSAIAEVSHCYFNSPWKILYNESGSFVYFRQNWVDLCLGGVPTIAGGGMFDARGTLSISDSVLDPPGDGTLPDGAHWFDIHSDFYLTRSRLGGEGGGMEACWVYGQPTIGPNVYGSTVSLKDNVQISIGDWLLSNGTWGLNATNTLLRIFTFPAKIDIEGNWISQTQTNTPWIRIDPSVTGGVTNLIETTLTNRATCRIVNRDNHQVRDWSSPEVIGPPAGLLDYDPSKVVLNEEVVGPGAFSNPSLRFWQGTNGWYAVGGNPDIWGLRGLMEIGSRFDDTSGLAVIGRSGANVNLIANNTNSAVQFVNVNNDGETNTVASMIMRNGVNGQNFTGGTLELWTAEDILHAAPLAKRLEIGFDGVVTAYKSIVANQALWLERNNGNNSINFVNVNNEGATNVTAKIEQVAGNGANYYGASLVFSTAQDDSGGQPVTERLRISYDGAITATGSFSARNKLVVAATTNITATLNASHSNSGSLAQVTATLPAATAGDWVRFHVRDVVGWKVQAPGGTTIRIAGSISASGGYIDSISLGDVITLEAISSTEWYATSIVGSGWAAH